MESTFQFTRYLYIKDEVKYSILISLLKKNEETVFWAYEFYYSGFNQELWDLFWKIYYEFYATLNPHFKKFLQENHENWKKNTSDDTIIAQVVENLKIKRWNMDVFLLKQHVKLKPSISKKKISVLLEKKDYEGIADYIISKPQKQKDFIQLNEYFTLHNVEKKKLPILTISMTKDELLSCIIHLYTLLDNKIKPGKKLYITNKIDISLYKNIYSNYDSSFYCYKILRNACKYAIDNERMLALFKLTRDSIHDLHRVYNYDWLYYASNTPIWSSRIETFGGTPNHEKKEVIFEDEDLEDEFNDHFYYDTDEQPLEIKFRNIGQIQESVTWKSFFEKESSGIYIPETNFWNTMKKISY